MDETNIARETLGSTGQVYVTLAAAQAFADAIDLREEEARLRLTLLLLDARPAAALDGREGWRHRSRTTGLDVSAQVVREGPLAKVVHVSVRGVPKRRP